jgi:hypothetical protein
MRSAENADTRGSDRSPWRHKIGSGAALITFALALAVVAAIEAWAWPHIVSRPDHEASYFLGALSIGFVVFLWMFLASILATWLGRPRGRWVAFGWASLTLAGIYPMVWYYRQAAPLEPTLNTRFLDFGLSLTTAILVASLLPRAFRLGIFGGLILAITVIPGSCAIYLGLLQRMAILPWLFGVQRSDNGILFVTSLQYSVYIGFGIGLLLGVLALCRIITFTTDSED